MVHKLAKVIYKPNTESTDEYIVIANPEEYLKWKAGDTSIPLAEVVDSFSVLHSMHSHEGFLGRPSRQQLENAFGTHRDVDVVEIILKKGVMQEPVEMKTPALALGGSGSVSTSHSR